MSLPQLGNNSEEGLNLVKSSNAFSATGFDVFQPPPYCSGVFIKLFAS